jgi:hypothetical protein
MFERRARHIRSVAIRGAIGALVAVCFLVLGEGSAAAQDDFLRSSPGDLARSHSSIDGTDHCNDCHTGGRGLSNDKCLGCHDHSDLRKRIRAGQGFHSSSKVKGKKCETCHLDHKGRGYNLMGWKSVGGSSNFDHDLAGWPLEGKHKAIDCSDCHNKRNKQGLRTYLGEDKLCGSCHKRDQPHGFTRRAMLKCERCHTQSVWKPQKRRMKFDHDDKNDAEMALEGSHADVSCGKCHPKAKFNLAKDPADFGNNCHKSPHGGHLFDKKCAWCHSPKYKSLDKYRFNHAKRTKFDLAGAHGKLDCYKCHTKKKGKKKPNRACEICHEDDNKHKDRFKQFGSPPKCATCHPSSSWKPKVFNHNKRTKFKLTGKHAKAKCRDCHRGKKPHKFERFNAKTIGCMGCHKHKNQHDGEFKDSECLRCHKGAGNVNLTAKSKDIYHGPDSSFPLVKKHKKVPCEKCHINDVYKDTPAECGVRCHEDSLHMGELGDKCSDCHSGGQWKAVHFDHTEDTKWPLKGLHATVPTCESCHPVRKYSDTPKNCSADGCHAKDDAHKGRLGDKCEKCHLETGDNIFNHNTMSDYKLDGKHLTTKCSDCHPKVTFVPQPTNCFGCHPEPKVHKGQYGTECESCHTTEGWDDIKALHDVGEFALKGAHDNIPCEKCHKDSRALAGSGNLCINCHRQDDIHSNSLSPRCGNCHSQWSFAPARFNHTTVGCNLTGLHRALPCYDCHKTGNFGGLSANCYGCHRDTGQAVIPGGNTPDHTALVACASCHNPNAWVPDVAYGRDSICR